MKIAELFKEKQPTISFEVFPPNKLYTLEKVYEVIDELSLLKPDFMSVTYGAGGSTRGNSVDIASKIKNINGIEALAHLTCIGAKKIEIDGILNELKEKNIENIMALRGDKPLDGEVINGDFEYANELIEHIKRRGEFSIGGAFYPEGHQETNDLLDLFNLKRKVEAGTDFLISQIFFENEKFYEFKEKLDKLNIKVPLVAGIMPITNGKQIRRITSMCGCSIPEKLKRILDRYEDNPVAMREAGIAFAMEHIVELIANDIAGIHIYTMNRIEASRKIMENIGSILRKRDEKSEF